MDASMNVNIAAIASPFPMQRYVFTSHSRQGSKEHTKTMPLVKHFSASWPRSNTREVNNRETSDSSLFGPSILCNMMEILLHTAESALINKFWRKLSACASCSSIVEPEFTFCIRVTICKSCVIERWSFVLCKSCTNKHYSKEYLNESTFMLSSKDVIWEKHATQLSNSNRSLKRRNEYRAKISFMRWLLWFASNTEISRAKVVTWNTISNNNLDHKGGMSLRLPMPLQHIQKLS